MPEEALQTGPLEVLLDQLHGSHGAHRCGYWMTSRSARRGPGTSDSPSPRVRRDLPMQIQGQPSGQYNVSCGGAHREPGTGDFVDADCRWTDCGLALMMRWPMRLCRQGYK